MLQRGLHMAVAGIPPPDADPLPGDGDTGSVGEQLFPRAPGADIVFTAAAPADLIGKGLGLAAPQAAIGAQQRKVAVGLGHGGHPGSDRQRLIGRLGKLFTE